MATVYKRNRRGNHGGRYYIAFFDYSGKRQVRSARTTDKATAERIAAKLEADAALRRDGVIDANLDAICRHSRRSVESHLRDYEAKMVAEARDEKHISSTIAVIRAIAKAQEFNIVSEITADGVYRYATNLKRKGRSSRTIHAHLTAIKGFTKWLTANFKLQRDPLAAVKKPNPKTDRRRERRMLLHKEWDCIQKTTVEEDVKRYGMTAQARVLLYAVAIQTGLRSGEIRSLTRGRLFLDVEHPYITCKAGSTKNKKDAKQYIRPEVAEGLKQYLAGRPPRGPVFGLPHRFEMASMLRADVEAARKAWLAEARGKELIRRQRSDFLADPNHEGEILDFHCLRHTCGAWLALAGAHPKAVQSIMRHSTITLTMDTYGHLFPGQDAETVLLFPAMVG